MEWYLQGIILGTGLIVLMLSGVPIAFSLGVVSVVALVLVKGPVEAANVLALWASTPTEEFVFLNIPLFVLMSEIVAVGGISGDLFDAMNKLVGRLPGALANVANIAAGIFAAICGSSITTAATIGNIAIPQMMSRGYDKRLAVGAIAAGGTVGILIPPSMNMVLYAIVTEDSVGKLFIAGVIPGIISVIVYGIFITIFCLLKPDVAPPGESFPWKVRLKSQIKIVPIVLLILAVLGTIYLGVATPTEAAAVGAIGAIIISLVYRRLSFSKLYSSLLATVQTTSFVLLIVIGAMAFAYVLTSFNITNSLVEVVTLLAVSKWAILLMAMFVLFILGMFLDIASCVLIAIPVLHPIVIAAGFDSIHFGIMTVIMMEIGLLTPPVGLNAFVTHGIASKYGVHLDDVFAGVLYFIPLNFLVLALVILVPQLALFLPSRM